MGRSSGESIGSVAFSFGATGDVQPRQVPTAKAEIFAVKFKIIALKFHKLFTEVDK